jgi:hypothetical protein
MIDQIKNGLIILLALSTIGLWIWGSVVSSNFKEYKESINDQIQQAKNEKIRIEAEQRSKLDKAKLDYSESQRRLSDALKRLRDAQALPRDGALQVAGNSACSVPGASENTARTTYPIKITAGTGSFTYENAMMDTLQCSQLIEFVK